MRKWPTQVSTVVANIGRELSLLKMAINMANADYPSFFSMERTGAPLPTAGSGVPGVREPRHVATQYTNYHRRVLLNIMLNMNGNWSILTTGCINKFYVYKGFYIIHGEKECEPV